MFKNCQKINITKHFLIPLVFIVLLFACFGASVGDTYASDLNQSTDAVSSELNIEDKFINSQENSVLLNNDENVLGISQDDKILGATYSLNGGTFEDIKSKVKSANSGDTIKLSGTFRAESKYDSIVLDKKLHFTSDSGATLDANGLTQIFNVRSLAAGTTFKNIKFVNGYSETIGAALYIRTNDVKVTDCVFEKNSAMDGGAIYTSYNVLSPRNLVVENCKFYNNHALKSAAALSAFGNNSFIKNCIFENNTVKNNQDIVGFGGAIQISLPNNRSIVTVEDCIFKNNKVDLLDELSHGGAGCLRDGSVYRNCIFINNSASTGGALTLHGSGLIENCSFMDNSAYIKGGALATGGVNEIIIYNCSLNGNTAPEGGAFYFLGENVEIFDCDLNNNYASKNGGAGYVLASSVDVHDVNFRNNVANVDGGALFIKGTVTSIENSYFESNSALPDLSKLDDGLGGAIYVNSTQSDIKNNEFYYNTARNGSAIYYDKSGKNLKLTNNTMYQNQAWVYLLPVFAEDIYYGDTEKISSIIHGGNNIARYDDLSVSNAIYNAADNAYIEVDGEIPQDGATTNGRLYQDDREYNMKILLTVNYEDGTVVYNKTLNSDCFGLVMDELNNLKAGKYYVSARHYEDTYYKSIVNSTTFTVTPKIDEKIKKSINSDEDINYHDVVIWTLNITNNGPSNATGVVVRDVLPEGLIWIGDDTGGKYDPKTGILNIGFLEVGEVLIVNIKTTVNKTGNIVNNVNITANEYDYNLTNNHGQSQIDIKPASDLAIVKKANQSNLNYGDLVEWTLTVVNNGPDVAHDVVVRDVLPKSLVYVSSTGNYNKHTGEWNIGTLNKGASVKLNIISKVNSTGAIENAASVTGREHDIDMSNNFDSDIVNVNKSADLMIDKVVNASSVNLGDVVKWTLTVVNRGPDAASGVRISDVLPSGFVYLDSSRVYRSGVIEIGSLAVGGSVSVDILSRVNATGSFVNVASVSGNEYDWDLTNNKDNASLKVKPAADLLVTKEVNESSPNFNDTVKWTISVLNRGPDVAHDAVVRDILPKELIFVSASGNYNIKTGIWNVGTLNKNQKAILEIITRVNATGLYVNNVTVSAREFDYNKSNNVDNETVNVSKASDLSIIKLVNSTSVDYLNYVKWTVIAHNNGPDNATGVYVDEILLDGLILVNYTASKGFYDNNMWSICCMDVGTTQTLELICKVNKTGTLTNVVEIHGNEYDPDLSNNNNNKSVFVPQSSDLAIVKNVNNSNPNYGDVIEWSVVVTNNGPDDTYDIGVIDVLPHGLKFIDYESSNGIYVNGLWEIDALRSGESEYLLIRCMVESLEDIENIAKVVPSQYDWNESNNEDNEIITVNPVADLSIIKLINVSEANYLDLVKWTLIVSNNGPNDATGVFVSDVIPKSLEIIDIIGDGEYDNGIWEIGNLENGQSTVLDIVCKIKETGEFTNVAIVWAEEFDPDLSNNDDENYLSVAPASDLSITKTVTKYKYSVGDLVKFSIRLTNNGPDRAENVKVNEIMDDNLLLKSFYASGGDFDKVNNVWSLDSLDVGESAVLKIKAIAKKAGSLTNKVSASSDNYDPDLTNNNDTVTVNVSEETPLKESNHEEKVSNDKSDEFSDSVLLKNNTGNPIMIIVLLFVFTMGAIYGNNILKKR